MHVLLYGLKQFVSEILIWIGSFGVSSFIFSSVTSFGVKRLQSHSTHDYCSSRIAKGADKKVERRKAGWIWSGHLKFILWTFIIDAQRSNQKKKLLELHQMSASLWDWLGIAEPFGKFIRNYSRVILSSTTSCTRVICLHLLNQVRNGVIALF